MLNYSLPDWSSTIKIPLLNHCLLGIIDIPFLLLPFKVGDALMYCLLLATCKI